MIMRGAELRAGEDRCGGASLRVRSALGARDQAFAVLVWGARRVARWPEFLPAQLAYRMIMRYVELRDSAGPLLSLEPGARRYG